MAAYVFRGRSLRSRKKSRQDDELISLDYTKGPSENLREVLQNLVLRSGTSKGKLLGYYNALVRLCHRYGSCHIDTPFSKEEVLSCLRLGFFHEAKEMRAACLRALRYYIQEAEDVDALIKLNIHFLIARSLDICLDNEIERIHAMRLIRHVAHIVPTAFPPVLLPPLVAIVIDGAKESDKMLSISLATLCELALTCPQTVAEVGGISAILRSILDSSQMPRINEALLSTILFLLNHPRTRHFIRVNIDLEQMLAPFTDNHYHRPEGDASKDQAFLEEREGRFTACKMAIATCMRSWPGIIRLCRPEGSGLQSLLGALYQPHMDTKKEIMDILYTVFCLPVPKWTDNFSEALLSVDASAMRDSWRLIEGFVAEEGLHILPHLARTRSNLVDNHLSLLLATFINAGLLEALVEVITTSHEKTSVRAIILLGELNHMANSIIPAECNQYNLYLPSLVSLASSFQVSAEKRNRASLALSCLSRMHALKKRGVVPCSLFLNHLMQSVHQRSSEDSSRPLKVTRDGLLSSINKETDHEVMNQAIRDSQVLLTKDNINWDWHLLCSLLKWPDESMQRLDDQLVQRFIRRLIFFFKPTNKLFAAVELSRLEHTLMGCSGMHLVDFLLECNNDDATKFLTEWLTDIAQCLTEVKECRSSLDVLFSPGFLQHTCSQFYFLFLGRCSASPQGEKLLESTGIYQVMLDLCSAGSQDVYVKLILSSMDYTRDGLSRLLLTKGLTSTNESARLYAVQWLHVLLRAHVPFFSSWGLELLNAQLYDQSKAVALEALSVLSEACEEEVNLMSLVRLQPSLLHLGKKGAMLLARFVSVPQGYKFLMDSGLLQTELDKWRQGFNVQYVHIVEERLNEALTSYEKTHNGGYTRRTTCSLPHRRCSCFVPVHLYGQLVQNRKGFMLLREQDDVKDLVELIRNSGLHTEEEIVQLKAALWAVGHIGTSSMGIDYLRGFNVIPEIIKLAEECGVFSIRGTAFFCLGLLASTRQGAAVLADFGWESVRRQHHQVWAIAEEEVELEGHASLSASSASLSSEPQGFITLPAVTVGTQGSPKASVLLPGKASSSGGSYVELSSDQHQPNGDVLHGSPVHIRSSSDPAPRPEQTDSAPVSLLRRPPGGDVRDERSSSNGSKSESFESSGVSSLDSTAPGPLLTPIPSASSSLYSLDTPCTSNHPSDMHRKMARLRQMARRRPTHLAVGSENAENVRTQPLTSPRDLAGYARLRRLKEQHVMNADLEAKASAVVPHLWEKEVTQNKKQVLRLSSRARNGISRVLPHFQLGSSLLCSCAPGRDLGSMDDLDAPLPPPLLLSTSLPSGRTVSSRCSVDQPVFPQSTDTGSMDSSRSPSIGNLRQLQRESESSSGSQDYVGISLPLDVSMFYQVSEGEDPRSQVPVTVCEHPDPPLRSVSTAEVAGLEHHSVDTCLGCFRLNPQKEEAEDSAFLRPGDVLVAGESVAWSGVRAGSKSRQSSTSDVGNLPGSMTSMTSIDSNTGVQTHMSEDSELGVSLIRQEALRLVVQLSSSVATKSTEQGLLILKQRFPHAFQDACLYSEVCYLLIHFRFRLTARRFIQELFQDVSFDMLWEEPQALLGVSSSAVDEGQAAFFSDPEPTDSFRLERVPEASA